MAKGLFTVFHDSHPHPPPCTTRRTLPSTNNKKLAVYSDAPPAPAPLKATTLGKENIDPYSRTTKSTTANNKNKLAPRPSSSSSSCQLPIPITRPAASSNQICTGHLRTRVLPLALALPPLDPLPAPLPAPLAHHSAPSIPASPASTSSTVKLDDEVGEGRSRKNTSQRKKKMVLGATTRVSDKEANRRARGLTESPLAEVTQAFTSLGSFALPPPPSPSPSPLSSSSHPIRRTSPTKSSSSSSSKPYAYTTTTGTTRKKKPSSSGSVPASLLAGAGAGGGERRVASMRF